MGIEKTIKRQARESLRGNISVLIAGFFLAAAAALTVIYLGYAVMSALGIIDLDTEKLSAGATAGAVIAYYAIEFVSVVLLTLLSPLLNGALKAAAKTAVAGKCEIRDLFFFFGRGVLYCKTVVINLLLFMMWSVLTTPLFVFAQNVPSGDSPTDRLIYGACTAASVIWGLLVYAWFVHYPLCAYALDESRGVGFYAFGLIGFSFKSFGKLLRLAFSLIGWFLLCFFVLPMIYVVPYASTAALSSARWLLEADGRLYI